MADYYSQCSVVIKYDTEDQGEWLGVHLDVITGNRCEVCLLCDPDCTCPDGFHEREQKAGILFTDYSSPDPDDDPTTPHFWIREDECLGDVDALLTLVEEYQTEFHLTEPWYLDVAHTCSKPRVGAFGGYTVLVYRGESYSFACQQAIEKATELQHLTDFEHTLPAL